MRTKLPANTAYKYRGKNPSRWGGRGKGKKWPKHCIHIWIKEIKKNPSQNSRSPNAATQKKINFFFFGMQGCYTIWKINVIYHIDKLKNKNHMFISLAAEKHLKISNTFHVKSTNKENVKNKNPAQQRGYIVRPWLDKQQTAQKGTSLIWQRASMTSFQLT
jgi:hypothetical protein